MLHFVLCNLGEKLLAAVFLTLMFLYRCPWFSRPSWSFHSQRERKQRCPRGGWNSRAKGPSWWHWPSWSQSQWKEYCFFLTALIVCPYHEKIIIPIKKPSKISIQTTNPNKHPLPPIFTKTPCCRGNKMDMRSQFYGLNWVIKNCFSNSWYVISLAGLHYRIIWTIIWPFLTCLKVEQIVTAYSVNVMPWIFWTKIKYISLYEDAAPVYHWCSLFCRA